MNMEFKVGSAWTQSREKRIFDVGLSSALAPLAAPVAILGGAAVALADKENPVFTQERVGLDGQSFTLAKIRTLPSTVIEDIPGHRGHDDPRATRVGSYLRKTHIDELPQGLSILRGDMTVIGPRPMVPGDYEKTLDSLDASDQKQWLWALSVCRPGVVMSYNTRQHLIRPRFSYCERALVDIEYANTASARGDVRMLVDSFLITKAELLGLDIVPSNDHHQTISAFSRIAESFGVVVTEEDVQYWRTVVEVAREIDSLVDEGGVTSVSSLAREILTGKGQGKLSDSAAQAFSSLFFSQSFEKRARLLDGLQIAEIANKSSTIEDVKELIDIRRQEADIFAGIIQLPNDGKRMDANERERFNIWLEGFTRFGYLLDSVLDIRKDTQSGCHKVDLSVRNVLSIAKAASIDARPVLRKMPRESIKVFVASGINKAIRNHLRDSGLYV